MSLAELTEAVAEKRTFVTARVAERDLLAGQLHDEQVKVVELRELLQNQDAAQAFLRLLAEHQQEVIKQKVEMLVTYGLKTVFDEDVQFRVTLDARGNQLYMAFALEDSDGRQVPLMDAEGGGLVALTALLLRIVLLLMTRPRLAPILVLDEPLTQLSECYREPAAQLILRLVAKGLLRVVAVTHDPVLAAVADKRYRFALKAGETVATEIKGESDE